MLLVKRWTMALLLALVLASLAAAGSIAVASSEAASSPGPPAAIPAAQASWTIAIYADGDNDLMYTWPRFTLPALMRIPANAQVNVVAMLDKPAKNGSWLYRISGPQVSVVRHYPLERDFGSGATFEWFLRQVHAAFPSDHLLVVGWDHGFGWHYFSRDTTSNDRILLPELRTAIADAGVPIDVLAFDACNMADEEVTDALASTGRIGYLVGSEDEIDQDGYPYDNMFTALAGDPSRTPAAVVHDMLAGWQRYYGTRRNFNWTSLSAIEMDAVSAMHADLVDWVATLRAGLPAYAARYRIAMHHSIYAWDSWQLDLGGFAAALAADPAIADGALKAASVKVLDDVAAAASGVVNGWYASAFTGLTVWAGTGQDWKDYRRDYATQVGFGRPASAGGTGWYGFLRAFNAGGQADPRKPDPTSHLGRARYGLSDVVFNDAQHGWATGFNNVSNTSFILRTTGPSGGLWTGTDESVLANYLFTAIAPAPGGKLWAVGDSGYKDSLIVVSADGGRSWKTRVSGTTQYLFGVDFTDAAHGWVSGAGGTLLRSANAGTTWSRVATAPSGDLLALDFTDATHGWVAAGDERYPAASLQYTADGGGHWSSQYSAAGSLLSSVDAVSDSEVWAAGGDPATGAGLLVHGGFAGPWTTQWAGPGRLADVSMVDAAHGWAVGDHGLILHTADGATWTAQASGVGFDLTAVTAVNDQTAWAVGDGALIVRTTDGGLTWAPWSP